MPSLRAIVSVAYEDRIQCQQPGCGHSVYRRVHVVDDQGIILLGSTCFAKRYGSVDALGTANHGSGGDGNGRKLTDAERLLLVENTAALLARFDQERADLESQERARLAARQAALQQRRPPPAQPTPPIQPTQPSSPATLRCEATPWPWQKPLTSMLYFRMPDGTGWVRVQHRNGQQMLAPWPVFEGWDECLPLHVGTAHSTLQALVIGDLDATIAAVAYLRHHCDWEKLSGHWQEIESEAARR